MVTQQRLREALDYCPNSGTFTWKTKAARNTVVGRVAGRIKENGYREIGIDGRLHGAHRLAWLYVHGEWPNGQIDHFNGNRLDNRISNLRNVSASENLQNQFSPHGDNPFLGVSWQKSRNKWRADICVNGKQKFLGRFDSKQDARDAYLAAKRDMHIPGRLIWPELAENDPQAKDAA